MALIDLAPPSAEPIDLAYAKTFLRVDGTDEDLLITTLIKTARHQVENIYWPYSYPAHIYLPGPCARQSLH